MVETGPRTVEASPLSKEQLFVTVTGSSRD